MRRRERRPDRCPGVLDQPLAIRPSSRSGRSVVWRLTWATSSCEHAPWVYALTSDFGVG